MERIKKTGKKKKEEYNAEDKGRYTPVDEEAAIRRPKKDYVLHTNDTHTQALLTLYRREDKTFSLEELLTLLQENKIVHGIKKEVLIELAEGKHYYEEVLIAQGIVAEDGRDGFFEYHFNTQPETRPIILADGSVDYNVLGKIELVKCGDLLVTYHPAVPAIVGMDVHGNVIDAYEGKDLPPLKCKRCELDESTCEYRAGVEGNVTLEDHKLTVTPVYFRDGNLDAATGNVDFYGDVLIEGNVFAGVTVKATGNITINGHVETATLIAGKDVILRNGMQGAGKGTIYAGQNVMARFLEQAQVFAGNEVNAGALLNCKIGSGNKVVITGKRGTVIGGSVMAVEEISAAFIGNRVGVKTKLIIGLEKDLKTTIGDIDLRLEENRIGMEEAMNALERIAYQLQTQPLTHELSEQRAVQTQNRLHCQSQIKKLSTKRIQAIDINERSVNGKIVVSGNAYAGCVIIMNGVQEKLQSDYRNVMFKKKWGEIQIVSNKLQKF